MIADAKKAPSVVFDLDGTLADTSVDLLTAANAAFTQEGLDAPLDTGSDSLVAFHGGRKMVGLGMERLSLDDAPLAERLYQNLLAYYAVNLDHHTRLYDGTLEALHSLSNKGYVLSVCTNKPETMAADLLEALGIAHLFKAMLGGDTLPVRKPDPQHLLETISLAGGAADRAVLVGDTFNDSQAAAAAGCVSVLVGFGPEGQGVNALNPDAILDHYRDLPNLVERLIGTP